MRCDMNAVFGSNGVRRAFFLLFILSGLACLIATSLHYTKTYPANPVTWAGWLLSMVFLLLTYFPTSREVKDWLQSLNSLLPLVFVLLAVFFVVSHLWNFSTAPWNENGIFDDAAWDIYFAKRYIFTNEPFQAAFPDGISREVIFHYYITFFFALFGYNLLTFNVSLIILGMTTFLFTTLLIHKTFNNYVVTITSAVIFNFLPLHFIQTFVGHRYAMAAPLIMASLYFLFTGFKNGSYFRVALSAILAALCTDSAVMGKHFVMSLFAAMILYLVFDYKKSFTKENRNRVIVFTLGLLITLVPLIVYVYYDASTYFRNESGLTRQFFESFGKSGPEGFKKLYVDNLISIFFGEHSGRRLSMQDYVIIPFVYYIFLIPGLVLALIKKRYEIILLALIPIVGAFVSSPYDFRVLHAVPFWIILMAFTFHELVKLQNNEKIRRYAFRHGIPIISAIVLSIGLVSSINYINSKSKNPNSVWLLPQRDLAVSRFLRDVVAGVPNPSAVMRHNELNKLDGIPEPDYETFACQARGFAITHLFLKDYDDRKIMSFCDQAPIVNLTEAEILANNKKVISSYVIGHKNLKLVWEVSDKTKKVIEAFKKFRQLGSDEVLTGQHAGNSFSLYILNIPKENIAQLQRDVKDLNIP